MINLNQIAKTTCLRKKEILTIAESLKTMIKRLASIEVESTLKNRPIWRQIILDTYGFENYYIKISYDLPSKTTLVSNAIGLA